MLTLRSYPLAAGILETALFHLRELRRATHLTDRAHNDEMADALAAFGYPPYAHRRSGKGARPEAVLLAAIASDDLDARIVAGLPWIAVHFCSELDWAKVTAEAVHGGTQNRLGFIVTLGERVAERLGDSGTAEALRRIADSLGQHRLENEDTLCKASMGQAERRWLWTNRTPDAETWRLLSDLRVEHTKPEAFGRRSWSENG